MLRHAAAVWRVLCPHWGSQRVGGHPLWLQVYLARFGCDGTKCLAHRAAEILSPESVRIRGVDLRGKLPGSAREGEVVVREDLCPSPEDSVLITRKTAWCMRMTRRCPQLRDYGVDYVNCALLNDDAIQPAPVPGSAQPASERRGGILDILMGLLSLDFKNQPYTSTLKTTAPILVWKAIQEQRRKRAQPATLINGTQQLIRSMLVKRRVSFTFDRVQGVFNLRDGSRVRVLKTGDVQYSPAVGAPTVIKANQVVVKLDALLAGPPALPIKSRELA